MGLTRLGISNPAANTDTTMFTSDNQYLLSVIATNKAASSPATIRVWVQPSGSTLESQYSYIIYDLTLDSLNSYETFRFAINQNDVVRIRSSTANISFSAYGIIQYDINIGAGISTYSATAPVNPVDGMIWVDSDGVIEGSTSKPTYVYSSTASTWISMAAVNQYVPYGTTAPVGAVIGDLWIDSSFKILKVWDGDSWEQVNNIPYGSVTPINAVTGSLWVDSTNIKTLKVWDGDSWEQIGDTPLIQYNERTVSSDLTLLTTHNGLTAGPVNIIDGVIATIPSGAAWCII